MTYDLSDDARRELTENVLREKWHHVIEAHPYPAEYNVSVMVCESCKQQCDGTHNNRTFDTPQDAHVLAKKLVEVGKWELFGESAWQIWARERSEIPFTAWLFAEPESPQRFSWLVNAYLEEKE
jgi:hypothetical protein